MVEFLAIQDLQRNFFWYMELFESFENQFFRSFEMHIEILPVFKRKLASVSYFTMCTSEVKLCSVF